MYNVQPVDHLTVTHQLNVSMMEQASSVTLVIAHHTIEKWTTPVLHHALMPTPQLSMEPALVIATTTNLLKEQQLAHNVVIPMLLLALMQPHLVQPSVLPTTYSSVVPVFLTHAHLDATVVLKIVPLMATTALPAQVLMP